MNWHSTPQRSSMTYDAQLAIAGKLPVVHQPAVNSSCNPLVELADCVDNLAALAVASTNDIDDLRQKIHSQRFDLVVAGQFKRGKTSLVNALAGAELLPVAVVPLTSIVTALTYGTQPSASIVFETGETRQVSLAQLPEYVTERGNPDNRKGVCEAHVTSPSPWLQGGIRLVDTPGVGSVYQRNTDAANRFLPKADAVLFLLSVDQPISQAECDFLASVRQHSDKIFFILNKIDLLTDAELGESIEFTSGALASVIAGVPKLFPLSARLALTATLEASDDLLRKSGMPSLSKALDEFLAHDKDAVLLASAARQVRRVVSVARFNTQLELKSLTAPLDELERKTRLFQEKKREIILTKGDFDVLLGSDASRALQGPFETDLSAFKDELKVRVTAALDWRHGEQAKTPLRQLQRSLEEGAIDDIKRGFDAWQVGESGVLERTFAAFCARRAAKIDQVVDEIFHFASDLFAIPEVPQSEGNLHTPDSHFYYKFWSEPPGLKILTSSLVYLLPRSIGSPIIVERVRQFAQESVEMQSGRVRHDFGQRLDKALGQFKRDIAERLAVAIAGIEMALEKASQLRAAGQSTAPQRHAHLSALQVLDDIDQRAARIGNPTANAASCLQS